MRHVTDAEITLLLARMTRGQRIDGILTAVAELLARTIALYQCDREEAIGIVARFTREWLDSGLLSSRSRVRGGEPDPQEVELEDIIPAAPKVRES